MAKTVPTGYRDFINSANAGIESSMRATWDVQRRNARKPKR